MHKYEDDGLDAFGWLVTVVAAICFGVIVWVGFLVMEIVLSR